MHITLNGCVAIRFKMLTYLKYAPLLNQITPCHETRDEGSKPALFFYFWKKKKESLALRCFSIEWNEKNKNNNADVPLLSLCVRVSFTAGFLKKESGYYYSRAFERERKKWANFCCSLFFSCGVCDFWWMKFFEKKKFPGAFLAGKTVSGEDFGRI